MREGEIRLAARNVDPKPRGPSPFTHTKQRSRIHDNIPTTRTNTRTGIGGATSLRSGGPSVPSINACSAASTARSSTRTTRNPPAPAPAPALERMAQ